MGSLFTSSFVRLLSGVGAAAWLVGCGAAATPGPIAPEPPETSAAEGPIPVDFPSPPFTLRGYLYKPSGAGPFPTLLYNHGSNPRPGAQEQMGMWFAQRGFVFFFPHRRGHGDSPGPYVGDQTSHTSQAERAHLVVAVLEQHVDDVVAGLSFLRAQSFVDKGRMSVAGCSYGGIVTLLTAEREVGIRAAVDVAGAAESWAGNSVLRDRLELAVTRARVPIFFMQSENDYNTEPSIVLSQIARDNNRPNQMRIFPPYGESHQDGHAKFCKNAMDVWGGEVMTFLGNTMGIAPGAMPPRGPAAAPAAAPPAPAGAGKEL